MITDICDHQSRICVNLWSKSKTMFKNAIWIFGFAIVTLIIFIPSYTTMQDLRQKHLELDHQVQQLLKKQKELVEEKRRLEEDPEYLEKVAREKMGLIKEGEVIYKILSVENSVENKESKE